MEEAGSEVDGKGEKMKGNLEKFSRAFPGSLWSPLLLKYNGILSCTMIK